MKIKVTLEFLKAELNLNVATLCMHLRRKAYPQKSSALYNAMASLVYYQILVDELSRLLSSHRRLVEAMEAFLKGEEYNLYSTDEGAESIYQFCLNFFTQSDCPLGSATPELTHWFSTHADRQQDLIQDLYSFYPDLQMHVAEEDETGEVEYRPATDEERFKSETEALLRNIETSNALEEFNQLMQKVRFLLDAEVPIVNILDVARLAN
jgi:hypothetical protein